MLPTRLYREVYTDKDGKKRTRQATNVEIYKQWCKNAETYRNANPKWYGKTEFFIGTVTWEEAE